MGVVIEFQCSQHVQAKSDWANLIILTTDGDYSRNHIVRCIHFYNNQGIRNPMHQDWGRGEGVLEELEHSTTLIIKDPRHALACQTHKGNCDLGVSVDEPMIEICEIKEGLDIL